MFTTHSNYLIIRRTVRNLPRDVLPFHYRNETFEIPSMDKSMEQALKVCVKTGVKIKRTKQTKTPKQLSGIELSCQKKAVGMRFFPSLFGNKNREWSLECLQKRIVVQRRV